MKISESKCKLIAIGGAEDRDGDCEILKEFLRLSKGPKARIVVMTAATDSPEKNGLEYVQIFKWLGVDDVKVVDVSTREDAGREESLAAIKRATGLFFTGGDQLHITSLIGGTPMQKEIFQVCEKGVIIGGTSAGAAMMSNSMIISGEAEDGPRSGGVEIAPGMDFVIGAIIDTHFTQRGRYGRLLTAVAHYPQDLGIGIDEDTALVFERNSFEVIGSGVVTIIDGGAMSYTNLPYVERNQHVALFDVNVHVLPAGYKFDLDNRRPIANKDAQVKKSRSENSGRSLSKKNKPKTKAEPAN